MLLDYRLVIPAHWILVVCLDQTQLLKLCLTMRLMKKIMIVLIICLILILILKVLLIILLGKMA